MFNFSGSEIIFLLLLALIILGPEKLPDAIRSFGRTYAEFKKMTTGFQSELKEVLDEPMREMRQTADAIRQAADFDAAADLHAGKPRSAATSSAAAASGSAGPETAAAPETATPPETAAPGTATTSADATQVEPPPPSTGTTAS